MAIIPPHIVDNIMQTARIEEVIGEFVQLKRAGANLKALSPFTDEKTPSFVVSPAKQIFKCFSTGKGGTVVSFLMEKEHYTYPEALKWLADKYGIQLPENQAETEEQIAARSERESLHIINEFAKDHFVENLHGSAEGKKIALSYFIERGFRPEIIEKFQLGYCLNKSNALTEAGIAKGYKLEYLEKVGLTRTKDDRSFDFFRGRVIFPIHSVSGRVLGFGGRTLITDKKTAKYFNSPESIIYNKSEILYGLYYAKSDIIKYDQCYLCEGYTDVISMHQAGIQNVVASSGTALTKEQIRLVKRYTNNITILYDGDSAGIKASFRGIDLILEEGMNVKVVLFPDGEDPDSYAKAVSGTELKSYIDEQNQDFISFKAEVLHNDGERDANKLADLIKELVYSVSLIPDNITRDVLMPELAKRFNIKEDVIRLEVDRYRRDNLIKNQNNTRRAENPSIDANQSGDYKSEPFLTSTKLEESDDKNLTDHNEYGLMRILILYGSLTVETEQIDEKGVKCSVETSVAELICHELNVDGLVFEEPLFKRMHQMIADALVDNTLLKTSYFNKLEDQEIVRFVSEIEMDQHELSPKWITKHNIFTNSEKDNLDKAAIHSIYSFKSSKVEKQIRSIQNILINKETELEEDELNDLLAQQVLLEQAKMLISEKLGRIVLK